jgi:hypothetical protein
VIFTNVAGELGGSAEPELAPAAAPVVAAVPVEAGASEPTAQAAEPTAAEMPGLLLETEGTQLWNSTGLELAAPVVYPTYAAEPAICSVDRGYWERSAPGGVEMADRLLSITQAIDPAIELTYRPSYIGLARQGQPGDFARFTPEQSGLLLGLSLEPNSLIELSIAQAGLERLPNEGDGDGYQIRLAATDIEAQRAPVARLIQLAYEESRA